MLIDESVETLRLTLRTDLAVSTRGTRALARSLTWQAAFFSNTCFSAMSQRLMLIYESVETLRLTLRTVESFIPPSSLPVRSGGLNLFQDPQPIIKKR